MASIFVSNLHPECNEANLYQIFAPVGKLLNIRLCRNNLTGQSLGYAFVNFVSKNDAEKAISSLNYTMLNDQPMRIMRSDKSIVKQNPNANICVKNLDPLIDEKALHDIFASYGNIFSLKLETKEDGSSKGFAFIQFEDEKSADEAIKEVNQKMLRGRVVNITKFIPREKRDAAPFKNVYVKNFGFVFTDEDLIKLCKNYGPITSAKIMKDEDGKSRGFGFVCFKESSSAKEAVKELNNTTIDGRRLFAGRAKKKAERQKEVMENFKRTILSFKLESKSYLLTSPSETTRMIIKYQKV